MNAPSLPLTTRRQKGVVARMLDDVQARGRLVVGVDELAQSAHITPLAVKRQLAHLAERVTRLPGRPSACLIVPPEHRLRGAPPVAAWLDAYFRLRGQAYYLGLLSAAALHGSSQQAVLVTQVMTEQPMRPITLGRVQIEFHVKAQLSQTPLAALRGLPAPVCVSSVEATALDLLAFSAAAGGPDRAIEVVIGLLPAMTPAGLRKALAAESKMTVKRRLRDVLAQAGRQQLLGIANASLQKKGERA